MLAKLSFVLFIVAALGVVFACGVAVGRWSVAKHYARFSQPSTNPQRDYAEFIRKVEYDALRWAIERHREQAPAEQQAGITACLSVMQKQREEIARKRPTAEYIAEGR